MKKILISLSYLLITFCIFILITDNLYSQPGWSSIIRLSAGHVDKNPVFGEIPSPNWGVGSNEFFAFERNVGANPKIYVMKMGTTGPLDTGVNISNNNFINRNPAIAYYASSGYGHEIKKVLVVWETNVNGNYDIYGSFYSLSSGWTSPAPIVVSSVNKSKPRVSALDSNHFVITYESNGDIYFKRYLNGTWLPDSNLTSNEPAACSNPYISFSYNGMVIYISYEKFISNTQTAVLFTRKQVTSSWSAADTAAYLGINKNIGFLSSWGDMYMAFESNRSGRWELYDTWVTNTGTGKYQEKLIYSTPAGSNLYQYVSCLIPIITDYVSSANAYVRKYQDSTKIITGGYYTSGGIYIGDTTKNTRLAIGRGLFIQAGFKVRMWLVFTKDSLAYTNLYALYSDIFMGGLNKTGNEIPGKYILSQNYPNPFNPATKINFAIPEQTNVVLKVYDLLGREAAVLVNGNLNAGYYTVDFNGTNYTSGVYIFKLETSNFTALKKMVLVK